MFDVLQLPSITTASVHCPLNMKRRDDCLSTSYGSEFYNFPASPTASNSRQQTMTDWRCLCVTGVFGAASVDQSAKQSINSVPTAWAAHHGCKSYPEIARTPRSKRGYPWLWLFSSKVTGPLVLMAKTMTPPAHLPHGQQLVVSVVRVETELGRLTATSKSKGRKCALE